MRYYLEDIASLIERDIPGSHVVPREGCRWFHSFNAEMHEYIAHIVVRTYSLMPDVCQAGYDFS